MTGWGPEVRALVDARDAYRCRRCGAGLHGRPFSRHHRKPRGMGGANRADAGRPSNVVLLCGSATTPGGCHEWVERNRASAREDGWLVPSWADPAEVPVKVNGKKLWLLDNGGLTYNQLED